MAAASTSETACVNHSTPPSVAFCIAGSARSFAAPLVLTHFRLNLLSAFGGSSASRLFLLLKTADSGKLTRSAGDRFHPSSEKSIPHISTVAALERTLQSEAWLAPIIGKAMIVNGSGAPSHATSCRSRICIEQADSALWRSYRVRACMATATNVTSGATTNTHASGAVAEVQSCCCDSGAFAQDGNNEERLLNNHLGIGWCRASIEQWEHSRAARFDLVLYARPDIFWWSPMLPWCAWRSMDTMLRCEQKGCDFVWVAPRRYLTELTRQHKVHRDCTSCGGYHWKGSCCTTSEHLLTYSARGIPSTRPQLSSRLSAGKYFHAMRRTSGACEFLLSRILDKRPPTDNRASAAAQFASVALRRFTQESGYPGSLVMNLRSIFLPSATSRRWAHNLTERRHQLTRCQTQLGLVPGEERDPGIRDPAWRKPPDASRPCKVSMLAQSGSMKCELDATFGCLASDDGPCASGCIWVDFGCRGQFACPPASRPRVCGFGGQNAVLRYYCSCNPSATGALSNHPVFVP